MSQIQTINRGSDRWTVFFPGWATDCSVFDCVNFSGNRLYCQPEIGPSGQVQLQDQISALGLKTVTLFGWSMGGYQAASFAAKYPALVTKLVLVSVRQQYDQHNIKAIKRMQKKSQRGFLHKFFQQCMVHPDEKSQFQERAKHYGLTASPETLESGLDYLAQASIPVKQLAAIPTIHFIHGEEDVVAPIGEARLIASLMPQAEFHAFAATGHMPFLREMDWDTILHD